MSFIVESKHVREYICRRCKSLRAMGLHDVAQQVEKDMADILKGELYINLPEPVSPERMVIAQDKNRGVMQ